MGYLRGSTFETMINLTNDKYNQKNLALVQKIPTPIKPIKFDRRQGKITMAHFEQKSTVDYIGLVQGVCICFDAKETSQKRFPLKNIHQHQINFMGQHEFQTGISFILVRFSTLDEIYLLPFKQLRDFWDKSINGGRKSIPYDDFRKDLLIKNKDGFMVHYLEAINVILQES